ncbi:MAG: hypothetical protein ACHQ4H_08610 [Ktedonobacterales bacterium]|jgi:hypothetical protein
MPIGDGLDRGAWSATTTTTTTTSATSTTITDLLPFWKRHLRAQIRLFTSAAERGDTGRRYRAAVVWGLTTFLHALQECGSPDELRARAQSPDWWDELCRDELESPSLLGLRVGEVPLSGKGVAECALSLRYLELTRRLVVDPTTVLDQRPVVVDTWLRSA